MIFFNYLLYNENKFKLSEIHEEKMKKIKRGHQNEEMTIQILVVGDLIYRLIMI